MKIEKSYDAVIVGAGHNGLVAACYLALAGLKVMMLEKNPYPGGATLSRRVFAGVDARLSVYSYLVSLLPDKILSDLGVKFATRRRAIASYTPVKRDGHHTGLLLSNDSVDATRQSFIDFYGSEREFLRYQVLQEKIAVFARKVWPTLLEPLLSRRALRARFTGPEERAVWDYLVEKPLSALIEDHLSDDTLRGLVFTDAKIGLPTHAHDPSLLQNRTFIYHTIGRGSGEWSVPVGGMGALVESLLARAQSLGVQMLTGAEVARVEPETPACRVDFIHEDLEKRLDASYVLFNTSSDIANRCLPGLYQEEQVEGSVFKINMLLRKLPTPRDARVSPIEAFTGTYHLFEGYQQLEASFRSAQAGAPQPHLPGEMYCHSLTDPSILAESLQRQGWHTLTLFGLDVPYNWFLRDNQAVKAEVTRNYLDSINEFIQEDIRDCLALDANGQPCLQAKSPLDLEESLGLPKGNIFHGRLSWPFAENEEEAGTWGVETRYDNILICGSSARRGGAVSGIPGHNAAMRVLEIR